MEFDVEWRNVPKKRQIDILDALIADADTFLLLGELMEESEVIMPGAWSNLQARPSDTEERKKERMRALLEKEEELTLRTLRSRLHALKKPKVVDIIDRHLRALQKAPQSKAAAESTGKGY